MRRLVLPLRSWLVLSHLAVLSLPIIALLSTGALAYDLLLETKADLEHQAAIIGLMVQSELEHRQERDPGAGIASVAPRLTPLLRRAREANLAGIRVMDNTGLVVASSGDQIGEDLSYQSEVREAMAGTVTAAVRPRPPQSRLQPLNSPSRRASVRLFLARPVEVDGQVVAVVLMVRTPREELQALYGMAPRLSKGLVLALLSTLGLGLWAATLFSRSLKKLDGGARLIARGSRGAVHGLEAVQQSHVREVGKLAESVTTMTRTLQSRLNYIGEFAGNVSHEFKTPIATLKGTIELLGDDDDMPKAQQAVFLNNAMEELDRMERMVTGLLMLARAEEVSADGDVDLDALCARVQRRYPEVQLTGRSGVVTGQATQLETVLVNLVENALQHGGAGVSVRLEAWCDEGRLGVDVVDDGVGISASNLPQVFDRFFTTDRAGGGTGLGLALVRAICQAHGGDVTVQSQAGETRFRLGFPR